MSAQADDMARKKLKPLQKGERPRTVTVAAIVAALLALSMIIPYLLGSNAIARVGPGLSIPLATLLLITAIGIWKVRYWALLGFQAYLALSIVVLSLALVTATSWYVAVATLTLILIVGALFWSLVKSLARIQISERQGSG